MTIDNILDLVKYWKISYSDCHHSRPWHDARAMAHACAITGANEEKGSLGER